MAGGPGLLRRSLPGFRRGPDHRGAAGRGEAFDPAGENGIYTFQQIRDQNYEFAVFLGLCPFDAHCWAVPKAELTIRWADPDTIELTAQHGGKKGKDTAWLSFPHDAPPAWLAPFGGALRDGLQSISRLTGFDLPAFGEEE